MGFLYAKRNAAGGLECHAGNKSTGAVFPCKRRSPNTGQIYLRDNGFWLNIIGQKLAAFYGFHTGTYRGSIYALCHDGTYLYAGGFFYGVEGNNALYIAMLDDDGWQCMGAGANDFVYALCHDGTYLYAAGPFTQMDGISVNHIAKWNPATSTWSAVGDGLNNTIYALCHDGTYLYAAGSFTYSGSSPVKQVARWTGSSWQQVGNGFNYNPKCLFAQSGNLYVGGHFEFDGDSNPVKRIAVLNGSSWQQVGNGIGDNWVQCIGYHDSKLCVGGYFITNGDGTSCLRLAEYTGGVWSQIGGGINYGGVQGLTSYNGLLYVAGDFDISHGDVADGLMTWDGSLFADPGSPPRSFPGDEYVVLLYDNAVYVGGQMRMIGGYTTCVAKLADEIWSAI
ncbi:MAG: hypothetical protein JW936_01285 [Sedimentisphaerales bacterium]|nr:hypothetical protein [Sedimentisphaerales bacterium]